MTGEEMTQLVRDALEDHDLIDFTVDEDPAGLVVYDTDGDRWTVQVRPR